MAAAPARPWRPPESNAELRESLRPAKPAKRENSGLVPSIHSWRPQDVRLSKNHAAAQNASARMNEALSGDGGRIEGRRTCSGIKGVASRLSVVLLKGPLTRPSINGIMAAEAINEVLIGENEFDTDFFSYTHTKATNPFAYTEKPNIKNIMECFYDYGAKSLVITNSVIGPYSQPMTYTITGDLKQTPCYEISNYQTDFWLAMRFYNGDFSDFRIGTVNLPYISVSNVSYAGTEQIGDILCDRWEICQFDKRGKPSHENQICWFNKQDDNYTLVKYQCNSKAIFPENIVMVLIDEKTITPEEWEKLVSVRNEELKNLFE